MFPNCCCTMRSISVLSSRHDIAMESKKSPPHWEGENHDAAPPCPNATSPAAALALLSPLAGYFPKAPRARSSEYASSLYPAALSINQLPYLLPPVIVPSSSLLAIYFPICFRKSPLTVSSSCIFPPAFSLSLKDSCTSSLSLNNFLSSSTFFSDSADSPSSFILSVSSFKALEALSCALSIPPASFSIAFPNSFIADSTFVVSIASPDNIASSNNVLDCLLRSS